MLHSTVLSLARAQEEKALKVKMNSGRGSLRGEVFIWALPMVKKVYFNTAWVPAHGHYGKLHIFC